MKRLILIIFAISLFHNFAVAQWVQQTSGVSSSFADVQFLNPNTGWVCGANGMILKTTNAGLNWVIQNSGVTETLYDLHAVDANTVYCVGIFETILKTTNGGSSWNIIRGSVNPGKFFFGLHFINTNTGWICGGGQCVLRTTNGGNSFDSSFVPTTFYSVYFKDNLNGLLAGQTGNLFKSTNGGINWGQINVLNETAEFFDLTLKGDIGWLIGTQTRKIYKTTNFGTNWDSIGRITGTNSWLSSIFFSSISTGWVSGDSGKIYKSVNGGIDWFRQVVPVTVGFGPSCFINDSTGWVVGSIGTIIHTTTGGQIVGISNTQIETSDGYSLSQNYPNPFNPSTQINYDLPGSTFVTLKVYNALGEEVARLVNNEFKSAGSYSVTFDGSNFGSGIYFYSIEVRQAGSATGQLKETKKMVLIK